MLKTLSNVPDNDATKRDKRATYEYNKKAHSISPALNCPRPRSFDVKKKSVERRCQSLSPSARTSKQSLELSVNRANSSVPDTLRLKCYNYNSPSQHDTLAMDFSEKDPVVPKYVIAKTMKILATKKREFIKLRKTFISQQNSFIENYASLKELEVRAGVKATDESVGEVRLLSVSSWPAHDLLMLIRDNIEVSGSGLEIKGLFGFQVLQQLHGLLKPIPEDVLNMADELMARRLDLVKQMRGKCRTDRSSYVTNMEWKTKNIEFDAETEQLNRMVAGISEKLTTNVNISLELAKVPWLDRDVLIKRIERLQKEIMVLQNKLEGIVKKNSEYSNLDHPNEGTFNQQALCEELSKERSAREALKDVVATAESMLRVARNRITTMEKQLKDTKAELEVAKKKHKDIEQLYRHRETSYDTRSRKLLEISKTGEIAAEGLSRQRDALELRVKELCDQAETAERAAKAREMELRIYVDSLQVKVAEQEKHKKGTDAREIELTTKVKELDEELQALRERSVRLVDMERRSRLKYVPAKESEPSDREIEIWKELQVTRVALSRTEEELRQSRADKDNFLSSLSQLAQGEDADKMAAELVNREQKISILQVALEGQKENEKRMEQNMTQYENKITELRLEVTRLRNYDCYAKEIPYQDLQTELLELHMQVEALSRERTALVTAAASKALMLERHERSADYFVKMTLARRDLAALIDDVTEPTYMDEAAHAEISRSLSSVCASAADTWTALRAERARVLRLQSSVLAQRAQLERENKIRTQLEQSRAVADKELVRLQHSPGASKTTSMPMNPYLVPI